MIIPFLSLKESNKSYEQELKQELNDFLDRGFYMLSDNVNRFETRFAEYCGARYCVGVANGLDALELILESFEFPESGEVIVPANTYYATILSILNTRLTPVFVEPDSYNFLIKPENVVKAINQKTVAILAVNLYGKMCDFERLNTIALESNLKLIVDAAQSHGAIKNNSKDCFGAHAIAYSFYPTKNLGALSDAGAVVTDDEKIAKRVKVLRNYGSEIKYQFDYRGRNSRLSELQAGFLNVKLNYLDSEINTRRQIASRYLNEIFNPKIVLPPYDAIHEDSWHLFVIRTQNRDELASYLKSKGVGYDIHYPVPPHKQKALKQFNNLSLPLTEEIHDTVMSIPLNSTLNKEEVNYIIETLNTY